MNILGVETSGPIGSIALRRDGRCVEERFLPELGRRHAQSLIPEVVAFLGRHQMAFGRLDAVAVSIGPGSFTGLRVGLTFAKSLAYAAGAEVVPVETFAAIAANTPMAGRIAVIADAQRGGVMLGFYEQQASGEIVRRDDIRLIGLQELPNAITEAALLTGPGLARVEPNQLPEIEIASDRFWVARAAIIARLGERQLAAGLTIEPWTLEPLYVRKSGAEEKLEERASKSADRG